MAAFVTVRNFVYVLVTSQADRKGEAVFSLGNKNFWTSRRMFRGCRKEFLDTNKKN